MVNVQRLGELWIFCCYRTASEGVILSFRGVIPIDLLTLESNRIDETSVELERKKSPRLDDHQTIQL